MLVEISPTTWTKPVVTSVSQATRAFGSFSIIASKTASEIWSAILSGWPSVTDSEVKTYVFQPFYPPNTKKALMYLMRDPPI